MKKYKLLRDLPTFKAGQMFELCNDGLWQTNDNGALIIMAYTRGTLDKFPNILDEWFEEIKESKVWEPETGNGYYYISGSGYVDHDVNYRFSCDENRIILGNCFKTEKDAEKAIEKLKSLRRLLEKGLKFIKVYKSFGTSDSGHILIEFDGMDTEPSSDKFPEDIQADLEMLMDEEEK